jgi:hypothetical protein
MAPGREGSHPAGRVVQLSGAGGVLDRRAFLGTLAGGLLAAPRAGHAPAHGTDAVRQMDRIGRRSSHQLGRGVAPVTVPSAGPRETGRPREAAPSWLRRSALERQQCRPYQILVPFVEPHPAPEFHAATTDDRKPIAVHGGWLRVGVTETGALAMGEDEGAELRVDAGH